MRPDVEEFFCGISFDAYRLLGSHPAGPGRGWLFTLWAPHARRVQLLGDWNGWDLYSAAELKTMQEVITLTVFVIFSVFYLKEGITWNHAMGFALIAGGAALIFRG